MAYFGPKGVRGTMHPALRSYIDCFLSPPLPKAYPRGGGPWDQDPILMRDFRVIRDFEVKWKESQEQMEAAKSQMGMSGNSGGIGGGMAGGINGALNAALEQIGEDGGF